MIGHETGMIPSAKVRKFSIISLLDFYLMAKTKTKTGKIAVIKDFSFPISDFFMVFCFLLECCNSEFVPFGIRLYWYQKLGCG